MPPLPLLTDPSGGARPPRALRPSPVWHAQPICAPPLPPPQQPGRLNSSHRHCGGAPCACLFCLSVCPCGSVAVPPGGSSQQHFNGALQVLPACLDSAVVTEQPQVSGKQVRLAAHSKHVWSFSLRTRQAGGGQLPRKKKVQGPCFAARNPLTRSFFIYFSAPIGPRRCACTC